MFNTKFYNQTIRNTIIEFGNLFSNIEIIRKDATSTEVQRVDVPISYSAKEKWLSRILQNPELNRSTMITLPRMAFDMTGLRYDAERKLNNMNQFSDIVSGDPTKLQALYSPVPYTLSFELNILAKSNDDILQIVEQILPFFTPAYNVTVVSIPEMGILQDIPIILHEVTTSDNYDADWETERRIIYTLEFTAKINLYGPIKKVSQIKKVDVDISIYAGMPAEGHYHAAVNPLTANKDEPYTIDELWTKLI